jgi:hypothetical protein
MEGANNSTAFTDSSYAPVSVARVDNVMISTAQSKWAGKSSAFFDGAGDALVAANQIGIRDFPEPGQIHTIEGWFRLSQFISPRSFLFGVWGPGQTGWTLDIEPQGVGTLVRFFLSKDHAGTVTDQIDMPLNTWHHIALVNNGTLIRLFLNGTLV